MPYFRPSTPDSVKKLFKLILKTEQRMKSHSAANTQGSQDKYYAVREELTALLSDMLCINFISLSKIEILKLLSLCSSYRPAALHTILISFSQVHEQATTKIIPATEK